MPRSSQKGTRLLEDIKQVRDCKHGEGKSAGDEATSRGIATQNDGPRGGGGAITRWQQDGKVFDSLERLAKGGRVAELCASDRREPPPRRRACLRLLLPLLPHVQRRRGACASYVPLVL